MKTKNIAIVMFAVICTASGLAIADSTSFAVKLEITPTCTISAVPAQDVDFGSHASTAGSLTAEGGLTANCTNGTDYTISLDQGSNSSGGSRRMVGQDVSNAGEYVPYTLYTNSSLTTLWEGGALSGTGTGNSELVPVYASLSSVNFKAGHYQDTVTATISY